MSPAAYAAQQREVVLASGLGTDYGLGVDVKTARGQMRSRTCCSRTAEASRARSLYATVRDGGLDRATLTANGRFYLTPAKLAEYRTSLAPLGEPKSVTQTQSGLRGGFTIERFLFDFGTRKLEITIRAEPGAKGLVEEFMATPVS